MNRIAVLMTCYNRVETTLRGLRSLFSAKPVDCEFDVFLVDDASPDGTAAKVRAEFPSVHVIDAPGNLFWCKGMRRAWDAAVEFDRFHSSTSPSTFTFSHFLWFNDDVVLKPGAIAGMLADAEVGDGLITGKFSSDESETDVSYGLDGADAWMNGNLVLVPRFVYDKIGPIYDGYRHAYGDHDYGLMAKRKGFSVRLSTHYCGVCPRQPERYQSLSGRSLFERFRVLFSTKGICLHDAVLFRYRNWGVGMAVVCFFHLIIKTIFGK